MIFKASSRAASRESAISLIECVVYLAVFALVLGLAFMALHRTWKIHHLLQQDAQDVASALHAGEQWRADVRQATGPISAGDGSADFLIQIPGRHGSIVYRLVGGTLRREIPGQSSSALLTNVRAASMTPDRRQQVTAWRWELELKSRAPKRKLHPLFTFLAVPPGAKL